MAHLHFTVRCIILPIIFLSGLILGGGDADCAPWNVTVRQEYAGIGSAQLPLYKVMITNECPCRMRSVILECGEEANFAPVEIQPRGILERVTFNPETCKLNAILGASGGSVMFVYQAEQVWPGLEVVAFSCPSQ